MPAPVRIPPAGAGTAPGSGTAPATLQDVARLAGVSAKTVARAVNGEGHVHPDTLQRVSQAAAALRFRPNRLARELRQGARTGAVGLVIGGLDNPYYSQLAAGVDRALREQDLQLVLASTDDDPGRESAVVRAMLERRVRALLIVPSAQDHAYLDGERQDGMPVVFLDRPPVALAADAVLWDDRAGVREAVQALVAGGHRRVAAVADRLSVWTARERVEAFRAAVTGAGLDPGECPVVTGAHDVAAARAAATRLLAASCPPTALLALNNRISVGTLDVLLRLRSDCAFIGFEEFDLAETLGVSIVVNDPRTLGYAAGQMALARLRDPTAALRQVRLPTRLLRRGTGERPPPG